MVLLLRGLAYVMVLQIAALLLEHQQPLLQNTVLYCPQLQQVLSQPK